MTQHETDDVKQQTVDEMNTERKKQHVLRTECKHGRLEQLSHYLCHILQELLRASSATKAP